MQDSSEPQSESEHTRESSQPEPPPPPPRSWDYSSDPLKAGGMQIAAVVIGFGVAMLLMVLFGLVWFYLS